ncbi:IclR family transcriptional regulator [Puniceibacterium sp. IMCC21224]|uniref:IclR family transcriptional regulator n=1 Tax=Puniceibacterium sp. IMCC21224 TaxID=1618204 RepID=UPI00064DB5E7|nr:IclR family transcriptional regulator [Puniceibacterium sp. IMCC21224]KMK67649.1 transcriptional regulator, IclR family [Puniceibacterium sp. IMCC21224]
MAKRPESVSAVERALSIMLSFEEQDGALSLAELARRTELDKATALRIARTLANRHFLVQNVDSTWRLGPALIRLGTFYQSNFNIRDVAMPQLALLARTTGESAALYVRENDHRVCLFRHDSEQSIRHHVRVGSLLPLDQGGPGRIILAFSGEPGEPYDDIRRKGYYNTFGERDPQVASVALPLFENGGALFGALALTGPPNRFTLDAVGAHLKALRAAGAQLTLALGGNPEFYATDADINPASSPDAC